VTQDPERLARFRREAQVLAALNHQHIASIYGLEEADWVRRTQPQTAWRQVDGAVLPTLRYN
jgi:serine/threonine protein kinase